MLENDRPQWTSLDVAEQFDKRHRDVVRAIRNLVEKESDLDAHYRLAFYPATRTSPSPTSTWIDAAILSWRRVSRARRL